MEVKAVRDVHGLENGCPAMKNADIEGVLLDIKDALVALGAGGNSAEAVAMFNGLKALANSLATLANETKDVIDNIVILVNEIKADYNLHIADDTLHTAADTVNTISSDGLNGVAAAKVVPVTLEDIPSASVTNVHLDLGNAQK